jgi:hypothetical protein
VTGARLSGQVLESDQPIVRAEYAARAPSHVAWGQARQSARLP